MKQKTKDFLPYLIALIVQISLILWVAFFPDNSKYKEGYMDGYSKRMAYEQGR